MKVIDIPIEIKKTGVFMSMFGIADTHFLCDDDRDNPSAFQPLNKDYYAYLRYCAEELKDNPKMFGDIYTYTGGDLTELDRSSTRKVLRSLRKNDSRGQDTIHKRVLGHDILPKLQSLVKGTRFIGGVAGNHLIEFSQESEGTGYINSEDYLIKRLGGQYCGEGKLLINFHFNYNCSRRCIKVLITHGGKGGRKSSIIKELQDIYYQYGTRVDVIIKAHAHDPMAAFQAAYTLPDSENGSIKTHETLIVCLGSTRGGEVVGYDDYTERCNYPATAGRYPVIMFKAWKPKTNGNSLDIKIRPYIM